MRDEGEQGMDGWMAGGMDRERGGDADVFLRTEFYCTHSVQHTTPCRAGRCNKAAHAAKHTDIKTLGYCWGFHSIRGAEMCMYLHKWELYTMIQWTVAMAKLDKIKLSLSLSLPPQRCYHTQTLLTGCSLLSVSGTTDSPSPLPLFISPQILS